MFINLFMFLFMFYFFFRYEFATDLAEISTISLNTHQCI